MSLIADQIQPTSRKEMRRIEHVHFVGIGGAGMSGIAEVLLHQGYRISGSDLKSGEVTRRLSGLGIRVFDGHRAEHVEGADVVVVSSAVALDNAEVNAARSTRIPIIRRAEMLAELMRYRHGIAVAGTHGKTTTTSLVASIFYEAGLDPTFIIGGLLNRAASNAQLGQGQYMIAEADESDASFLHLQPMAVILTNVDRDHLVNFEGSFSKLQEAFLAFVHNLPFYGLLIACEDDPVVASMLPAVMRPVKTYGFSDKADYRILKWQQQGQLSHFEVARPDREPNLVVDLLLPGRHNALNALAAIAVACEEGVEDEAIRRGLTQFSGVGRRFEVLGDCRVDQHQILLIDDYGHHPTEVRATIEAVRDGWPERRLVMVYQPHRYSRTAALFEEFVAALSEVDVLLISNVYAAGEEVVLGAEGQDLYLALQSRGIGSLIWLPDLEAASVTLESLIQDGDVVLTQGAGDTAKLARSLADLWQLGDTA
jgi:UDP-N-acetylmuramate--alanine ligase